MVITKQDFEIYLEFMMDYLQAQRPELRVSVYKMFSDGSTEIFEECKILSTLESGIIVWRSDYDEDEEYDDEDVEFSETGESVFVPWSSMDEITITKIVVDKE
ncbi:MAG: hypothetical protein ACFE96_18540 [Candidatus Hermodarchaeota archaeon]